MQPVGENTTIRTTNHAEQKVKVDKITRTILGIFLIATGTLILQTVFFFSAADGSKCTDEKLAQILPSLFNTAVTTIGTMLIFSFLGFSCRPTKQLTGK